MSDTNEQATSQLSQDLRERLGSLIKEWQWEERFSALQGAFSVDKSEQVQAVLEDYFKQAWTAKSIKNAPLELKQQGGAFSALNKSQLLYSDASNSQLLAAWWPWSHGATVSVRLFQANSSEWHEPKGVWAKLTRLFS